MLLCGMFDHVNPKFDWTGLDKFVRENLLDEPTGHDYEHIKRVLSNVYCISKGVKVNMDVLIAAALLHDISCAKGMTKIHHIESAALAKDILLEFGFDRTTINAVYHAIINHNFIFKPYDKLDSLSMEAKILSDADTLDALGAIGMIRMISFSAHKKIPYFVTEADKLDESFYGNLKYLDAMKESLLLKPSKKIAEERMVIVHRFLKQLESELTDLRE